MAGAAAGVLLIVSPHGFSPPTHSSSSALPAVAIQPEAWSGPAVLWSGDGEPWNALGLGRCCAMPSFWLSVMLSNGRRETLCS